MSEVVGKGKKNNNFYAHSEESLVEFLEYQK